MSMAQKAQRNRICIAILAMGGQGGGVLADWIQDVARNAGWIAQGTSVPGVAQRTGSTVYYIELARPVDGRLPVMAQMPVPGDVDIVIASELMEAGRSMLRNFTTPDRTACTPSRKRPRWAMGAAAANASSSRRHDTRSGSSPSTWKRRPSAPPASSAQ
jgi:indolepyruvate ferredoxin oxidoreductase beta subunit